jgi:hypothetical protein
VLRCVLVICAVSMLLFDRAEAQGRAVSWPPLSQPGASSFYAPGPATPLRARLAAERSDTTIRQIKPTYWKEGGLIGGVVSGVLVGLFAHGMCTYDEGNTRNCGLALISGVVIGGGMGFSLGALIGGQVPKQPAQE